MLIFRFITNRKSPRGMSVWYDLIDWLGGYPFEVATPEAIFYFYKDKNFNLKMLKTVGGRMGCNEFVFQKNGI
jgi:2-polyprenyl-6-hydroxyphenyl methylase/3-demethylubiquinone-9 3-methyltransferase